MIKIITAMGNPNLNNELRKYNEFKVIGNDILYYEGILEILEVNKDINYLIVGDFIDESDKIKRLICDVTNINRKTKIIAVINKKNRNIEDILLESGITDIFYDDGDILDLIDLLKCKNIEYLNIELREEIETLKEMLLDKNRKRLFPKKKITERNREKNIIGVTGSRAIGKTSFCIMLANALKKENRILIIDFDLINSNISEIYNKRIEYEKIDENNINSYIFKLKDNIDILVGLDILYKYKKLNYDIIRKQIYLLKEKYNYIIIDTYSEITFGDNKKIYNLFDYVLILSGLNKIDFSKTKRLFDVIKNTWGINNEKINLIYYKNKLYENLFNNNIKQKSSYININYIRQNKNGQPFRFENKKWFQI